MEAGVNANAFKLNELKLLADRKTKELKQRIDNLQSLKLENDALKQMKDKATPEAQRIEKLLAGIEDTRQTTEEKLHYRRQLQHMFRRLSTNQISFDAHINAMEDALRIAIKEHEDVKALMRQLEAGRTKALLDLHDIQRQVSTERRDRAKVVSVRKMEALSAKKMEEWRKEREQASLNQAEAARGDLSAEEERALQTKLAEREELADELRVANEAKLAEFNALEEQFTTIRQATGVNTLEEMVEKFIGQEGNRQSLLKEQREVETRLGKAKRTKEDAEIVFTELKARGIGTNELNREVSDELQVEIQAGRIELKTTRAACERLEKILVAMRQGAIGLFQRMEHFQTLLHDEEDEHCAGHVDAPEASSSTIEPVEALNLSELIIAKMMESVGSGEAEPGQRGGGGVDTDADDDSAQASADNVSSTWTALATDDVPNAKENVRVRTTRAIHDLVAEGMDPSMVGGGASDLKVDGGESSHGDEDGPSESSADLVPTRDFLKLSASRQHAEVMRKEEMALRRKKMQDRIDAADDAEKEKLGSLADKKKRQKEAIDSLCTVKKMVGVPKGITPKLDAMQRSTIFLDHKPELL